MPWTEATRRPYRRDGLRYASNLTDAERALIEPFMPAARRIGRPHDLPAGGGRGDPVSRRDRRPVTPAAKGVPAGHNRPGLFLSRVAGRHV